jgi:hypothetical protein
MTSKLIVYREDPDSPLPFLFVLPDGTCHPPTAYGDEDGIVHAPSDEDFAAVAAAIDAMSEEEFASLCAAAQEQDC